MRNKTKQVILYILYEIGAYINFNKSILPLILYFLDMDYYEKYQDYLLKLNYKKTDTGLLVGDLEGILEEMKNDKELLEVIIEPNKIKFLPLVNSKLENLSGRELKHIDDELDILGKKSYDELSEACSDDIAFCMMKEDEIIEYDGVLYRK